MAQIYRIYVNDKRIIITSNIEKAYPPDCKKITEKNLLPALAGMINGNDLANFVLFAPDPGKILSRLKTDLHYLEAAGGLVRNRRGQYLFIFRHGKWDLPKGKLDPGESPEEAALREVEEECGITLAALGAPLEPTWHAYALDPGVTGTVAAGGDHRIRTAGQPIGPVGVSPRNPALKKTYWYHMEAGDVSRMKPQTEEGITEVRWFSPDELDEVRANTYRLIGDMIEFISA